MKNFLLAIILTFSFITVTKGQSIDISKYKILYQGKEITVKQLDSLAKIYPSFSFDRNESVTPPTLTVIPETKRDIEERKDKEERTKNTWLEKKIEPFDFIDINNNKISLTELNGKIVVFNFYFTNCSPCIREMPELNQLVEEYKDKDVRFIAFALDKADKVNAFLQKHPFSYTQVPNAKNLSDKFKVSTWPTHIILDKDGIVKYYSQGFKESTIQELRTELKNLTQK